MSTRSAWKPVCRTGLRFSHDKKTIYVTTNDHSGVEVIDVASRKVVNKFVLNATHRYRMNGGAPDPQGKVLYTTTTQISKLADRYEIGKPKYTIIDLTEQKISKIVDEPSNNTPGEEGVAQAAASAAGVSAAAADSKSLPMASICISSDRTSPY